jgi:hypothetical protein
MKKIITILGLFCLLFNSNRVSAFEKNEVVPEFYRLLLQSNPPTLDNEKQFFGENVDEIAVLLSQNQHYKFTKSKTPVWDYLRDHKDLFVTREQKSNEKLRALIRVSNPYNMSNNKSQEYFVTALFPDKYINGSSYEGLRSIIFRLGTSSYLDIGATILTSKNQMLFEKLSDAVMKKANPEKAVSP